MYEDLVKRLRSHYGWALNETLDEAADAIEELETACDQYEKNYKNLCEYLPKWIPVTERLPETDGLYLVSVKNDHKRRYSKTAWYEKQSWFARQDVTYWMPLPTPPAVDIEEQP